MSQRNPQNARSQGGVKGHSRKSSSSAKPSRPAGASVRTSSKANDKKARQSSKESKAREEAQKERQRINALRAGAQSLPEYKKWRRAWMVLLGATVVFIAVSWGTSIAIQNGAVPDSMRDSAGIVQGVGMALAYASLIGAFVVDFRKIRPIRKTQEERARNLSKRQKKELDAAIEANDKVYQAELQKGGNFRMPWSKKNGVETDGKGNVMDTGDEKAPEKK